jgi:hypothetical protein
MTNHGNAYQCFEFGFASTYLFTVEWPKAIQLPPRFNTILIMPSGGERSMPYPSRTVKSDLYAELIVNYLDEVKAPKNYMVCVVTTATGDVFVAPSGAGDKINNQKGSTTMDKLLGQANWWGEYILSKNQEKKKTKLANAGDAAAAIDIGSHRSAVRGKAAGGGVSYSTANAAISEKLTASQFKQTAKSQTGDAKADAVLWNTDGGRRDCAEPRALEMAAKAGAKITGMTTIWYGDKTDQTYLPFKDPSKVAQADINPAKPCDVCRANEQRIMAAVDGLTKEPGGRARRHSIG